MTDLPKTFDPAAIEARWYAYWEEQGLFRPDRPGAGPFTIVMPPPNVTGSLHIGHALDDTLQDILIRHARLKGKDALWVVGTDHAGIATQMVVERDLAKEGVKRTDLGREAFIRRVWDWKAESGGQITRQLRRLGASCDWANERFTMDEGFSKAVTKVFVDLYNQGLLYRDKRLVNWDPGLKTAISDLEVETREVAGKFWHLRYPLADGSRVIQVATTRPETMLADMAVVVHPDDERYRSLVGQRIRLPITGRLIPIIADAHADPELGSGAVKITPGHDFNDFEVGVRAGFKPAEMLNMFDADARVAQTADGLIPADLIGIDRFEARDRIVGLLEEAGALDHVEDRTIQVPHGDRSNAVIEPWLTDQWYVDAKTLAGPAIEAVRSRAIEIVPPTWKKTWYNWLENIQPWCVSRQLWWGHRIPAWYGPIRVSDTELREEQNSPQGFRVFVAASEESAAEQARIYYGPSFVVNSTDAPRWQPGADLGDIALESKFGADTLKVVTLHQDEDVLDTWFSSALWPFATLGWPEADHGDEGERQPLFKNPAATGREGVLSGRYPNDVLISGFDILFFWDARMAMQGLHIMGDVPFRKLYLHGLVRDATGAKMSKSKGNTVDPLSLIDRYGADALRFTLAAMESQGRDIKLDEKRIEGYRNFATKLWNAARFCQANGIGASMALEPPRATLAVNRWIIGEVQKTVQALDLALADVRFDEAANTIYHFTWDRFCDWYLELIKPTLQPAEGAVAEGGDETRATAGWVLDQILVMLHPFMPFVTEELWHALGARAQPLIASAWPLTDARAIDPQAHDEIEWLIRLVSEVRAARAELNVPPGARVPLHVREETAATRARMMRQQAILQRLARVEIADGAAPAASGAQIVVEEATFVIPLAGIIDLATERARLAKSRDAAVKDRDALAGRLANASFVERAKPDAVEKARADHADKAAEAERLSAALERLG